MYIYQIENLINHKKYIGSTNDYDRRKKEHFNSAFWESSRSYNYPLQKAIRKYGKENFQFSILEECDKEFIVDREKHYILLNNSLTNSGWGYNQTLYTECSLRDEKIIQDNIKKTAKRCAWVDKDNNILQIFNSYHDAARTILKRNDASGIGKVCEGKANAICGYIFRNINSNNEIIIPNIIVRPLKNKVIGINVFNKKESVIFDSISEAASSLNIERKSIQSCIKGNKRYSQAGFYIWRNIDDNNNIIENDLDIDEIISIYSKKYIYYNNKYQLVTKVAEQLGLCYATVRYHIRNGKTPAQALGLEREVM